MWTTDGSAEDVTPNTTHVLTRGSNVWLDADSGRYMRMPRDESPRERAEWSDERAGVLQDAVWHPMIDWSIGPTPAHDPHGSGVCQIPWCPICPGLMIDYLAPDGTPMTMWFPNAAVVRAE